MGSLARDLYLTETDWLSSQQDNNSAIKEAMLDALRSISAANDETNGALTSADLQEALGWNEKKILKWLRVLIKSGQVEVVRVDRLNILGNTVPVPAYKIAGLR